MARKAEITFTALVELLHRMDTSELTALLTARPDAMVAPEPRSLGELAMRLRTDHSVRSVLHRLPMPQMELAEALQAVGDGCPRVELERLLGVGEVLEREVLDELLAGLRGLALAWTDGATVRLAPGMDRLSVHPLGLGQSAARLLGELTVEQLAQLADNYGLRGAKRKADWIRALLEILADQWQLRKALSSAPPGVDEVVEQLVWHSPRVHGPIEAALHRYSSYGLPATLSWLAQHGLVLPSGWEEGQMPREVALALRGEDYHPRICAQPPVMVTAVRDPAPAPQAGIVDSVRRMLVRLGTAPVQQLAAGGVGIRELRRITKELGSTEGQLRLALELAAAAGLVFPGSKGELLPTRMADSWLATPPGAQLVDLIVAWQEIGPVPSHSVNAEGKPLPVLDPDGATQIGPTLRTDLLGLLAEYPAGTAVTDLDSLIDVIAWRHPLRYHNAEALGPYLVATWTEAQRMGLVADTTLSALGRAVATGADRPEIVELAGQILPAPVDQATFLPDLTAVVSGPPSAELTELLDAVADPESRDIASTWRFSPTSVRRALDSGHTAEQLLARLATVADRALPQPIEYLINDAARRHGQLQVRAVSSAVCTSDPALAAEIAAHRKLADLELTRLAPTVLGSTKPAKETLRLLRTAGYSPVQQSRTGQTVVERVAPRRAPDPPPVRRSVAPTATAPDVLSRRLVSSTVTDSPDTAYEEVKAIATTLDDDQVRLLAHAIEHGSAVRIDYVRASGGYTERVIEPISLFFDAVQAWCQLQGAERVFRLDRIRSVTPV